MDTHDSTKTGPAENKSCLNVCMDMLLRANGYWPSGLSAEDELRLVVGCMLQWLRGQVCIPLQSAAESRTSQIVPPKCTVVVF